MAARAVRCRGAEGRPDVTTVACNIDVRAIEDKAGTEVVERFLRQRDPGTEQGSDSYQQRSQISSDGLFAK